jgi:Flp pilus assembly protein TadD
MPLAGKAVVFRHPSSASTRYTTARWHVLTLLPIADRGIVVPLFSLPFGRLRFGSSMANRSSLICAFGILPLLGLVGCQFASPGQNAEGVKMFQQAYYQGALQKFQQAIESDPHNPDGYYNLGATYYQMAKQHGQPIDWQQAEAYYQQCLQRYPNHADCHRALAVLMTEQGRQQDALRLLENWVARDPSSAAPKIELARLYDEAGNPQLAKDRLVEAVSIDPNNARALAALGKVREQLGDTSQALTNYERSLAVNQYQPQLAARVASMRSSMTVPTVTPPNGTRVVTTPNARLR